MVACFEDGPLWFRLLHQWKYGGEKGLAAVVAESMCADDHRIPADGILVPIPDDAGRRMQRGYSPVADLARHLAHLTGRAFAPELLRRARPTASQTSCAADRDRRANIQSAFRVGDLGRWPRTRALVLVEDQITSGATVLEAAPLLAARGAPVVVWCAARAARAPHRLDGPVGRH